MNLPGNRIALIVGVNEYSNGIPSLSSAVSDANGLAVLLRDRHGYEVILLDSAVTRAALLHELTEALPRKVGPDDQVLFYFAGHGIAMDGDDGPAGYLIPQDAVHSDPTTFLPMQDLLKALDCLKCRHLLAVLDCCFAGCLRWSSTRHLGNQPSTLYRQRFDRYLKGRAWQAIASASHRQEAIDVLAGPMAGDRVVGERHSPFAAALIEGLNGKADLYPPPSNGKPPGDGVITVTELFAYLWEKVAADAEAVSRAQTPVFWPMKNHEDGEYIFLCPGRSPSLEDAPRLTAENNPYRGLEPYDTEHKDLFAGRAAVTTRLVEKVEASPLTVVTGASGTGKSSLVRAGLTPELEKRGWLVLPPLKPGRSPLIELVAWATKTGLARGKDLRLELQTNPTLLTCWCREWIATHPNSNLLVIIDQLEELITLCLDDADRNIFLMAMANLITEGVGRIRLIFTVRSDFEGQFRIGPLKPWWETARFLIPLLDQNDYREIITFPASARAIFFETPKLIDDLINEVLQMPGGLPLLSFTLSEMYLRYVEGAGDDRCLTHAAYDAVGGVVVSLRNRVNCLFEKELGTNVERETLKHIMLRMVSMEGGALARRRVPLDELIYSSEDENQRVKMVLEKLTTARLVVTDLDADGRAVVEPAHDTLINGWDRLLKWTREEQEQLALLRLLTPAANDWKSGEGGLWNSNPRLTWLKRIINSQGNWLNQTEIQFIQRSLQRRRSSWIIATVTVIAAFLALSALTVYASIQRDDANARANDAKRETARLQLTQGEQAQGAGQLQSALHFYAGSLTQLLGIGEDDPSTRLRLGMITRQTPLLRVVLQAPERIDKIAFSRDLTRLITYADIGGWVLEKSWKTQLWNMTSGQLMADLSDGKNREKKAVFSQDGRLVLVLTEYGNRVSLWDSATGKRRHFLEGHTNVINDAHFITDGTKVITCSRDGTARVWDCETGQRLQIFQLHDDGYIHGVRYSPDGTILAGAISSGAKTWDGRTGKPRHTLPSYHGCEDVQFSPDGKLLISLPLNIFINRGPDKDDYRVRVWDVLSGQELHVFEEASTAKFVGSSERLFVQASSRGLGAGGARFGHLYDVKGFRLLARYEGHIEVSPRGDRFVVIHESSASLAEPVLGRILRALPGEISKATFSPDGRYLMTNYLDNTARLWDAKSGELLTAFESYTGPITTFAFSTDGRHFATATADKGVRIWDFPPAIETKLAGHIGDVRWVKFGRNDDTVVTASFNPAWTINKPRLDLFIRTWDTRSARPVMEYESIPDGLLKNVLFDTASGRLMAEYQLSNEKVISVIRLFDVGKGGMLSEKKGYSLLGFSKTAGIFLTTNGKENQAWNLRDGSLRYTIPGEIPNDSQFDEFLTSVVDNTESQKFYDLQIYDAHNGRPIHRVEKVWQKSSVEVDSKPIPMNWKYRFVYSRGARKLVVLSDNECLLVDLKNARITGRFQMPRYKSGQRSKNAYAIYSPDERFLATVGDATSIWNGENGHAMGVFEGVFLEWHPGSSHFLTLSDGQVMVWDVSKSLCVATIRDAHFPLTLARFDQTGSRVVTGNSIGTIDMWDVASAMPLFRLGTLQSPVSSLCVSLTNKMVLAGSSEGDVRIWPLEAQPIRPEGLMDWLRARSGTEYHQDGRIQGLSAAQWIQRRNLIQSRYIASLAVQTPKEKVATTAALLALNPIDSTAITTLAEQLDRSDDLASHARRALTLSNANSDAFRQTMMSRLREGRVKLEEISLLMQLDQVALPELKRLILQTTNLNSELRASLVYSLQSVGPAALELLTQTAIDADPAVRMAAAQALTSLGKSALPAAPALAQAIGMDHREARMTAARALLAIGPDSIPTLIDVLKQPKQFSRLIALVLLQNFGNKSQSALPIVLTIALEEQQPDIRDAAVATVKMIDSDGKDEIGRPVYSGKRSLPLIEPRLSDRNSAVRVQVVRLLAEIYAQFSLSENPAIALLGKALSDPAVEVRDIAARALINGRSDKVLRRVTPKAIPSFLKLLQDPDRKVRGDAMMTIWKLGSSVTPWTRDILVARQDVDSTVSIYAAHTLRKIGKSGLPYLITALKDHVPAVRQEAAIAIGWLNTEATTARPQLDQTLDDAILTVRLEAAKAMLQIGPSSARVETVLLAILQSPQDPQHRVQAAEALGQTYRNEGEVIRGLIEALDDKLPQIRLASSRGLIKLGVEKQRVVQSLIVLLPPRGSDIALWSEAVRLLGVLGTDGQTAIPAILRAVNELPKQCDLNLVMSFGRALINLQAFDELLHLIETRPPILIFEREIFKELIKMLDSHPERSPRIALMLDHGNAEIRKLGAQLLGGMGPEARTALPRLEKAQADPDDRVRNATLLAIENVRAQERLEHDDEAVRLKAAKTLILHHSVSPRVIEVLVRIVRNSKESVLRTSALHELTEVGKSQQLQTVSAQLLEATTDADPEVRFAAADGMLTLNVLRAKAIATLVADISNESKKGQICATAASRLAKLPEQEMWTTINKARLRENVTKFPDYANSFIYDLGSIRASAELLQLLKELHSDKKSRRVIDALVTALENNPDKLSTWSSLLQESDPVLRVHGVDLLGRFAGQIKDSVPKLREFLKDSDERVRNKAREVLERIEDN